MSKRFCLACCACLALSAIAGADELARDAQREIYVPYEELSVILERQPRRVYVDRAEYETLVAQSRKVAAENPPLPLALVAADYTAMFEPGRAKIAGSLTIDVLADGLQALELDVAEVGLRSATLDGKPATLGSCEGRQTLFVSGRGRHELLLEIVAPLETTAAQQKLKLCLPAPPAAQWTLVVPGNVEVRAGASVMDRSFDEATSATKLTLSKPGGPTELVLSLNNRQKQLDRIAIARSVLIDRVEATFERLDATVSLDVVHGATDLYRWRVPQGFEIVSVRTPLLAEWGVKDADGGRVLEVRLREESTGRTSIAISAERAGPRLENWTLPRLEPLDVAAHSAAVGLLLDRRLEAKSLQATRLVPIDRNMISFVIDRAIETSAWTRPPVLAAAYYAPQGDFELAARLEQLPRELDVVANMLLTVAATKLETHLGIGVRDDVAQVPNISLEVPAGWQITSAMSPVGTPLRFEVFAGENGASRVDIVLPVGTSPGEVQKLNVVATSEPPGWLGAWQANSVPLPVFKVTGATEMRGAVAVATKDDLIVLPGEVTGLRPLDESEQAEFGLAGIPSQLSYQFESGDYSANLAVQREKPRLHAQTFSFLRIEPDALVAHYELIYEAQGADVDRLALLLPASTPADVAISGLDGLPLKKSTSEAVGETKRRWLVDLAEPRKGTIRLVVDFVQNIDTTGQRALPLVEADGVAYQTGTVAIETSADLDVQVEQNPRKLDVAELTDAEYQPGRRLLGVLGTIGRDGAVSVKVARRETRNLPPVLVERAELVSFVSTSGVSQTVARYLFRTKASSLEIALPKDSTLWAVLIDGVGSPPQREDGRLLVNLPGMEQGEIRDLQIVYETQIDSVGWMGNVELAAPRLVLRTGADTIFEVPTADLQWHLHLPTGYQMTSSHGTVFPETEPPQRLLGMLVDDRWSAPALWFFSFKSESQGLRDEHYAPAAAPMAPPGEAGSGAVFGKPEEYSIIMEAPSSASQHVIISPTEEPPATAVPQANKPAPAQPKGKEEGKGAGKGPGSGAAWALEGLRSLKIDLAGADASPTVTFRSLGLDPQLKARVQDAPRVEWIAAAVATLVVLAGIWRTFRPARDKVRLIVGVVIVAALAPQVTGLVDELRPIGDAAILAALALLAYYLFVAIVRWFIPRIAPQSYPALPQAATTAVLAIALLAAPSAQADEPPAPRAITVEEILPLIVPGPPVDVPDDAVIVPYDPTVADPASTPRVLVPYERYVELMKQAEAAAHPDAKTPPADYGLAGASYAVTLAGDDYLDFSGQIEIESFVDRPLSIPFQLNGGVLLSAQLDGHAARFETVTPVFAGAKPANVAADSPPQQQEGSPPVQPPAPTPILVLHVDRAGRAQLKLTVRVRVERSGGWRKVTAGLPLAPATALEVAVPKTATEVRLSGVHDRHDYETTRDGETISTALSSQGTLSIEWRPIVNQGQVDASLAATSRAVFDVREDRQKLAWHVDFELRRDQRDRFELSVPAGWLVERVVGENVRGWQVRPGDAAQLVEVTLLQAAKQRASMTILLSREAPAVSQEETQVAVPIITAVGAQTQQARVTIRRSPLLELRTTSAAAWQRIDLPADPAAELGLTDRTTESPLGVAPFESYEFVMLPGPLVITARAAEPKLRATLETIVRLSDRELALESRVNLHIDGPPLHVVRLKLPADLELQPGTSSIPLDWIVTRDGDVQTVEVRFARGARGDLPLVFRGTRPLDAGGPTPLPSIEVVGASPQQGAIVVQSDSALDVRAEQLKGCETATLTQVLSWLKAEQRPLVRFALSYREPGYGAQLIATPHAAVVSGITVSNVRVAPRAIEETVLIELQVEQAGIREVTFTLPASMREARISAPLLRRKSITPIDEPAPRVRVRVEFQDDVMGQVRILAENDRQLEKGVQQVPVPFVETGRIDRRYFTIEAAGRDEVEVQPGGDLSALVRQQQEWATLAQLLGPGVGEAYVATGPAPSLAYQLKDRVAVETAQARIGFAEARLIVDGHGAYRAAQEYRVANSTEAWLEVELPVDAQLWAAQVADEPVKPGQVAGAKRRVRIPLVKTAQGDADYPVVIKYGGQMPAPGMLSQLEFPLPRTINIRVEQSQVRLLLPESHRWFGFGGTMLRKGTEEDLLAEKIAYGTKQLEQIGQVLSSETASEFEKVRARNSYNQVKREQAQFFNQPMDVEAGQTDAANDVRRNLAFQNEKMQQVEKQIAETQQQVAAPVFLDNRGRLSELYETQESKLAKNEVERLDVNFDMVSPEEAAAQYFDLAWFEGLDPGSTKDSKESGFIDALGAVDAAKTEESEPVAPKPIDINSVVMDEQNFDRLKMPQQEGQQAGNQAPQGGQAERDVAARYADKLQQRQSGEYRNDNGVDGGIGGRDEDYETPTERDLADRDRGQNATVGLSAQGVFTTDLDIPFTQNSYGNPAAGLVSLDVTLPERGREYLFTTPLGDTRITAWASEESVVQRLFNVAWMLAAIALGGLLLRRIAATGLEGFARPAVSAALFIAGLLMVCTGLIPLVGLVLIVLAAALFIAWLVGGAQRIAKLT